LLQHLRKHLICFKISYAKISWFSWWLARFVHQVHFSSGYIKEDSRPNCSLKLSFAKESFRVLVCSLLFFSHSCIMLMHWVVLCSWVVILRNHSKLVSTSWFLGLGECLHLVIIKRTIIGSVVKKKLVEVLKYRTRESLS